MIRTFTCFLVFLSFLYSGYGQSSIISGQSIPLFNGKKQALSKPALPPHRTCGTMEADSIVRANNPGLGTLEDFETWLQKKISQDEAAGIKMPPVYTVPVIVHIIHNGEAVGNGSNISQAQVNSQIDVLNEDYRRTNADASNTPSVFQSVASDIEIQFCPAVVDPNGVTLTQPGIDRVNRSSEGFSAPPYSQTYIDGTIKPATYWDPTKYFNIWVLNLSNSLLGYAQFPSNSGLAGLNANGGAASTDGVVVLYTAFGRVGNVSAPYNKGRTLTHEAGHWLGLRHIWGDSNCGTDYCNDTPTSQTSNYGCPSFPKITCSNGPNGDMFMNYMDYTDDNCMNIFTTNQKTRMRTVMQNSPRRVELITSTVCNSNSPPVCGFTASSFTITEGASINYTDQSGGTPSLWSWTFQGGAPGTSTQQNPSGITYNTAGTYNTTLIATNAYGTCTLTQAISVIVNVGCDTLNYPPPGTLVTYTGGGGYVCGWNTTYKDISKADYFANYSPYTHVTGGLIYFKSAYRSSGSNATVSFRVWNNAGTGGSPGTILATKTISLQNLDAAIPTGGGLYKIIFDAPIAVSTPFYFGITMNNFLNADSLGITSNTNGDSNPNTAWEQWSDNTWYAFDNANSWGISISQFISPFMTNLPPNTVITASDTEVCVGSTITFNGAGSVNETSYNWTFTGGNPAASTSANPSVSYSTAGTYKAVLTVTGSCEGTDKDSLQNIIINNNPTVNASGTGISCNGGNNGTATATASGGNSPFGYSWSNGQTGSTATGLTAGTYIVTVTDNKGCNANATVAIAQPSALTVSTTSTNSNCGGTNGSATAVPSGGTSPYNFLWNNGQATATATGLAAGTYTVTITDNSGCTTSVTTTVSSSGGGLAATTSVNNPTCFGGNNGSATANPSGGVTPYNYNWSTNPVQSNQTATGLAAGTYSVTISDVNTCSVVQSVTVSQPPVISLTTSQTDGTCGNANGSATVNASGGSSPFSYSWNNGQITATATGLAQGNYSLTVTDNNNCTSTSNFTIGNSNAPTLTLTVTNVSCNGLNNGSASAGISGGTTPINYSWSNGSTGSSINNLSPGTYTVSITDANGCATDSSVTISQPGILNSSAAATNASCYGICDGALSAIASGGTSPYSFLWSNGLGSGAGKSNVCAGNYAVTTSDANNCNSASNATVNQPPAINLNTSSVQATCGNSNGSASVNASGGAGGFSYLWNNGQTGSTATSLPAGSYSITVTDVTGCKNSATVSVSNDIPTTLSINSANVSCNGGNNGSATAIPGGGTLPYTYSWSNGGAAATINSLMAGTYTVTVQDASNCTVIQSVNITDPAVIMINSTSTAVSCNGNNNGSIALNASGGTSPFTYNWSNGSTQQTLTDLSPGIYSVTITDNNNCTANSSDTITEPAVLSSGTSSVNASCSGTCDGSLGASASGGTSPYSFSWNNGLGSGPTKTGICAGNYSVTVADANNCSTTVSATVTQPAAINLSLNSSNATCGISNGSASVIASGGAGGFSYLWNNGSTNSSISNLSAGTYSVTVTDALNCSNSTSVTVSNPGAPALTINTADETCNGSCNGSATVNISGGISPYSYQWSNGQTVATTTSLCAGTIYVTVTDANSCLANSSSVINQPSPLSVSISLNNNPCEISATATGSGGNGGYSYLWNNGQNTATATGLSSGNYSVTAFDANSCSQVASINVTGSPATITITSNGSDVTCYGSNNGSATLNPSGGTSPYNFNWSNGQNNNTATGLSAGTYTFTATDANGCTGTGSVNITEPNPFSTTAASTNVSCNSGSNGSASVNPGGGVTPYTYNWSNNATTANVTGLSAGTYSITVTDFNGCTSISSATVSEPALLTVSSTSTSETCGLNNGTGTVNVNGGTTPYTYQWDANAGSQTSQTATGLNGGAGVSYTVIVLDANGCFKNISVPVLGTSAITGSLSSTDANCGASDGSLSVNVSGGTPPYAYQWSNGATTSSVNGLSAGIYTVTVTDNAACVFSSPDTVYAKPGVTVTAATSPAQCGFNNGLATVSASGGISPYAYTWSNGDSTSTSDSLYAGNYWVIVTDINGCADTANTVVGGTNLLSINPIISNENCGKSDGVAIASVSGGTSPYSFIWSDSLVQTSQVATGLKEGTYTVTITDANGCFASDTVTITNTSNLVINSLQAAGGHCGSNNGTVASYASGGPLPYNYLWNNGDTTATAIGMVSGTYYLTVTDAAGCEAIGTIFVGSTPLVISDSVRGETCEGKNDGGIDISVHGGVQPYSYKWSNEVSSEDLNNIGTGNYVIIVTDANGCPYRDTITVELLDEGGCLDIPSGFTPNADGKNDTWKIRGIGNYPEISVDIFNRWGSMIFRSKGYQQPWDGTLDGKELPSAAYYYVITLGDGTTKTGSVTIVR